MDLLVTIVVLVLFIGAIGVTTWGALGAFDDDD